MLFSSASALGTFELQGFVTDAGGAKTTATLVLTYPDSLAGSEVRALLAANRPGTEWTLLPRGELTETEREFLEGLRDFAGGGPDQASDAWGKLRGLRLHPLLQSCLNVDEGLLLCLRGETAAAESVWTREWRRRAPAAEGAWRNLLGIYTAEGRYDEANRLLNAVLKEQPRNHLAILSQAALIKQTQTDSDWEDFLRAHTAPRDSLPDLQLEYGEMLVDQKHWAQAVPVLDHGLSAQPHAGQAWLDLADAQYHLEYYVFALTCLQNAWRAGYQESEFYELYARVLRACCMAGDDANSAEARRTAEHLLEEGLPKDLNRRSMAQLLYHVYCQNGKPEAAMELRKNLWFHFEGPSQIPPPIGYDEWPQAGLDHLRLHIQFGLYAFNWVMALRRTDFYQAF